MRVFIAGGIHEDPLCRPRLVEWLQDVVEGNGAPTRVAVEQDENIRATLKTQRFAFERLASGLWGDGIDPKVARVLSHTMAWEVDAHREVLDIAPFFLDEPGTRADAVDAKGHFFLMFDRLDGFAGDRADAQAVGGYVDTKAIESAERQGTSRYKDEEFREKQAKREATWAKRLRYELRFEERHGWVLAVVGALHASRYDDRTFRTRMAAIEGFEIADVFYLAWSPPAEIA